MSLLTVVAIYLLKLMIILMVHGPLQQCPLLCYATSLARCASSLAGKMAAAPPPRHTVFFLEILVRKFKLVMNKFGAKIGLKKW